MRISTVSPAVAAEEHLSRDAHIRVEAADHRQRERSFMVATRGRPQQRLVLGPVVTC